jgi:hypothetical protein
MQAKINKVELRNLEFDDYKELKNSMVESYPEMVGSYWKNNNHRKTYLVILICRWKSCWLASLIVDESLVDKTWNWTYLGDMRN